MSSVFRDAIASPQVARFRRLTTKLVPSCVMLISGEVSPVASLLVAVTRNDPGTTPEPTSLALTQATCTIEPSAEFNVQSDRRSLAELGRHECGALTHHRQREVERTHLFLSHRATTRFLTRTGERQATQ